MQNALVLAAAVVAGAGAALVPLALEAAAEAARDHGVVALGQGALAGVVVVVVAAAAQGGVAAASTDVFRYGSFRPLQHQDVWIGVGSPYGSSLTLVPDRPLLVPRLGLLSGGGTRTVRTAG